MSVDDVMKSGLLNVIGLFSRDVIGWKTRVEFVNSHWSVSIKKFRKNFKKFRNRPMTVNKLYTSLPANNMGLPSATEILSFWPLYHLESIK